MARCLSIAVLALVALGTAAAPAAADGPKVVASIKPIHSLVAGVMDGVGTPTLLVRGAASPHTYSLKPSEARALDEAELVFWVGEEMEAFLERPLAALAADARVVTLSEAPGVTLVLTRKGGAWEAHEEHEEHEEHAEHEAEHARHHDEHHAEEGHEHEGEDHDHAHGEHNMHIWLDPENAKAMVRAAVAALGAADAANAGRYAANGERIIVRLDKLDGELRKRLAPVRARPYVVFHDAYHYLEHRYGLSAVGSITVSPDRKPGAKRLYEIRRKIVDARAVCVFSEPQFEPALVATVVEGTPAKTGVLDPLGADLDAGPDAYFRLLRNLAASLRDCLVPAS